MTQVQQTPVLVSLRPFALAQIVGGAVIAVGGLLPPVFGTPFPVISATSVAIGIVTILAGLLARRIDSRLPDVASLLKPAVALIVAQAIVGYGGAVAIALTMPSLILGIVVAAVIALVTFGVGLLAIQNRQTIVAAA